jgi:hypothetical protein
VQALPNGGAARSGAGTIAGQALTVTQSGAGTAVCGATEVTSLVSVGLTGLSWIPPYTFSQTLTVRNASGTVIHGPLFAVLIGEPTHYGYPYNSMLAGGGPVTRCFSSQGDYLVQVSGDLPAGQTGTAGLTWLIQSNFAHIGFSIRVLSGIPSY